MSVTSPVAAHSTPRGNMLMNSMRRNVSMSCPMVIVKQRPAPYSVIQAIGWSVLTAPFFATEPLSEVAENCPLVSPYTPLFSTM